MTFNPTKTQLRVASISMLVLALMAVVAAIVVPVKQDERATSEVQRRGPATATSSRPSRSEAIDFSDLMDVAMRKPLASAHPATAAALVNGDSTAGLKLIGTILEPLHSYAIFSTDSGKTELKSVGEKAGLADISNIGQDSVTLRVNGRSVVLHAVRPPSIGGPGL